MWEALYTLPRGRVSARNIIAFVAATVVATFVYLVATATPVHAADAEFKGNTLTYDSQQYSGPLTASDTTAPGLPKGSVYFSAYSTAPNGDTTGYLIVLPSGTKPDTAQSATQARYYTGDYDINSGQFSNLSPPKDISLSVSTDSTTEEAPSSCAISGVGWIICNMSSWIAEGMDWLYGILGSFFKVSPLSTATGGLYKMWGVARNLANAAFVIVALIMIYSMMTGGMMSNYGIKRLLPRLIIGAMLVNVSYLICALAIDLSNILGVEIQNLLVSIRDASGAAVMHDIPTWQSVTAAVLGASGITVGGALLLGGTGGTAGALAWGLLAAMLPAIFAALVAVMILAARQALIVVFVAIAPLAFVLYLLPNTEEWFHKWRKAFTTLLIMFPAFSVIFGGSQLAGLIIIQNATNIVTVILGLAVQVVPLFITPFLIKLSSGLMGTIAGMANDKQKGLFDRTKNWADSNRKMHQQRGFAKRHRDDTQKGIFTPTGAAQAMDRRRRRRERMTAAYEKDAGSNFERSHMGQRTAMYEKDGEVRAKAAGNANTERWQQAMNNEREGYSGLNARQAQHQAQRYRQLRALEQGAHTSEENAKALEGQRHATNNEHYQHSINKATAGTYEARIRQAVVDTKRLEGQAGLHKAQVEADGELSFRRSVDASAMLTRVVKDTHHAKERAAKYEKIVQDAAAKSWNDRIRTDDATRELHLRATRYEEGAKIAEEKVKTIVENARAGHAVAGASAAEQTLVDQIQQAYYDLDNEARQQGQAKAQQTSNLTEVYFRNTGGARDRAGGIRGAEGAESVLAAAVAADRKEFGEREGEQLELLKHFKLSGAQRQSLAMGNDVTVTVNGQTHTFLAANEYARDAVIEEQLKTGSFSDIEAIIEASGTGGITHDYRSTISNNIAKLGLDKKALYWGGKTIDDVGQGNYSSATKLQTAAQFIRDGKVKDEVLAVQDASALETLFSTLTDPAATAGWSAAEIAKFQTQYQKLRAAASRVLDSDVPLGLSDASREVLERNRT